MTTAASDRRLAADTWDPSRTGRGETQWDTSLPNVFRSAMQPPADVDFREAALSPDLLVGAERYTLERYYLYTRCRQRFRGLFPART
jgi:hypothetical protein